MVAAASCATPGSIPPAASCPAGFDATFVQLGARELAFDEPTWAGELGLLRALGVRAVVLQFSGDEHGPYDDRRPGVRPVAALLRAAGDAGIEVYLGLHADPSWPELARADDPPPRPLDTRAGAQRLGALCDASPACAGFYLPQEIDDETWGAPERARIARAHLERAARALRAIAPDRPILAAPFFTGTLDPEAHARFWAGLLAERPVDVLMLQDGVGTGRARPADAARYLAALRPVAAAAGVRLWSVVEIFRQKHGPPRDDRPFAAVPAPFAQVRDSLAVERPLVERAVAFAVLDYMHPGRSAPARRLYERYRAWCARDGLGRSPAGDGSKGGGR